MATCYDNSSSLHASGVWAAKVSKRTWLPPGPALTLILFGLFHLGFSASWISYFSHSFHFGKRIVILHACVILSLFLVSNLLMGSVLSIRTVREWRFTRIILSVLCATTFSGLALLYVLDFVSNKYWGSNINLDLVSQYFTGKGIFQKELQSLSLRSYLIAGAGLIGIFSIYFILSRRLIDTLVKLLSTDKIASPKAKQVVRLAGTVLGILFVVGLVGFQSTNVASPYRERLLAREPIVSLFTTTETVSLFTSFERRLRLEHEEDQIRATYPAGQSFQKRNVVLIVVDSLRADRMQLYGYDKATTPFLSEVMKSGKLRRVETALAACADTECGVMATLGSKLATRQIPQAFTLPELLQTQGYGLKFLIAGSHRFSDRLKTSFGNSPNFYFDATSSKRYDWNDDRAILEGLENVPEFSGVPTFLYFHLMSTHALGIHQNDFERFKPSRSWVESIGATTDATAAGNYYDNGVLQADATVRDIFNRLREKGYLQNSLAVITSDHGEILGELDNSVYGHFGYLSQGCLRVPFLIYEDSPANYANLEYATHIDIAPTIVDRLGLRVPSGWQGKSLLLPASGRYTFHQTSSYPPTFAVIHKTEHSTFKYLRHFDLREELFDLVTDPEEKHDLMPSADREMIDDMRRKLAESLSD